MARRINKVREIDVAAVAGDKTLSATSDRRAVERCKEAIEKLGFVHTPVVGVEEDGSRRILSGQCELTALRELGVGKMDAVEVDVPGDGGHRAKLSLLLMSLHVRPGALCEGLLLQEAVAGGVPRAELQAGLGKSASWVSNRLSLVTRLDRNVYGMVKSGLLGARSAQEIARLPADAQFAFAETAVREGLPKSAVDLLVAGYNDETCPGAVRAQIIGDPRAALKRMADGRRAVSVVRDRGEDAPPSVPAERIKTTRAGMAALRRMLCDGTSFESGEHGGALRELETELCSLLAAVRRFFSPGKTEGAGDE